MSVVAEEDLYRSELLQIIQNEIDRHPRSHQKKLGPSEVGGCETKIAFKLAYGGGGDQEGGWAAAKGTVLHAWLDAAVFGSERAPRMPDGSQRFFSDIKLDPVHHLVNGGTLDLYDLMHETVIDFKLPGDWSMSHVRKGEINPGYIDQAQVYGLHANRMGVRVSRVGLLFLPMNGDELKGKAKGAILKTWSYDEDHALAKIANVERIDNIVEIAGPARALEVLPKRSDFCQGCPAFIGSGDRRATCPGAAKQRTSGGGGVDPSNPFAAR